MAKLIKLSSYLCMGGKFPNHDLQALLQHNNGDQSWSLLLKDDDEIIALDDDHSSSDVNHHLLPKLSLRKSLKAPPNPRCRILHWSALGGLVCTVGYLRGLAHEILVFNPLTGSSRRLPHPATLDSGPLGMAMARDPSSKAWNKSYTVIIFDAFYIHTYSSMRGDWATTLAEESFKPSTGVIVASDELVYYACDSETLLLSLYDWKLLRRVSPPCGSIRVDERDVSISNNLVDFRGRYVTVSGVRIEGSDENSIAVWELDQGKRVTKSPWVLWLCMPCNLLKDFIVKVEQTTFVRAYQFEASFTGRLVGASLKGHPELGGLAYDTKLDVWSHVPESAFRIAVPPLVCFQPDFRAIP